MVGPGHNYRDTVSPWFRSILVLHPDIDAMAAAPVQFKVHTLIGMLLFAIWPFTRLVHAFTAPVGYLFRPCVRPGMSRRGCLRRHGGPMRVWTVPLALLEL